MFAVRWFLRTVNYKKKEKLTRVEDRGHTWFGQLSL